MHQPRTPRNLTKTLNTQCKRLQLLEIWCSQPCHWIPTDCSVPRSIFYFATVRDYNTILEIHSRAAKGAARGNIVQCFASSRLVKPRIDKAHGWFAGAEAGVVEQGDDRGNNRGGCAGAAIWLGSAVDDCKVTVTLLVRINCSDGSGCCILRIKAVGCDIWKATATEVNIAVR